MVLTGVSAGGLGVDANCDLLADSLHSYNPDIKVKCISDSGSLYPLNTHSPVLKSLIMLMLIMHYRAVCLNTPCLWEHTFSGKVSWMSHVSKKLDGPIVEGNMSTVDIYHKLTSQHH